MTRKDPSVPKTAIPLMLLIGLLASVSGCDSQASQQAEAQKHIEAALTKLDMANAGYIADDKAGEGQDLLAYRQKTMDAATGDLEKVLALNAPQQKVQALSIIAQINASAARHAARDARIEQATLAGRSTVLLGYISALDAAAARAQSLTPMTDQQIADLQVDISKQTEKQQALTKQIDDLQTQLAAVNDQVQQFQDKANQGDAEALKLDEQAFVTHGDKTYELQDQAAQLKRKAAVQSASAEQKQVTADNLSAQLDLARVQLDTVNKLLAEMNEQVQATQADTARLADQAEAADQAKAEALTVLAKEYQQLTDVYDTAVEKRMKTAEDKMDQAVQRLEQAAGLASSPSEKDAIKLKLISAYADQAHIAISRAAYARDFASTTESVIDCVTRTQGGDAILYKTELGKLTDALVDARDRAAKACDAGLALTDEIAPEGTDAESANDTEQIALKQRALLTSYQNEQLQALTDG